MEQSEFLTSETSVSEITIQPDGRLFVFGASEELLRLLAELGWADSAIERRLTCLSLSRRQDQDSVQEAHLVGQSSAVLEGSSK